jgi:hypothetical protein
MIRNFKALGLALAAVFALSAVAASAASATNGQFTSDGSMTLTGTETGTELNYLEAFGQKVECPGTTYTGHAVNSTNLLPSGSTTATITPHYKDEANNCRAAGGLFMTVTESGCDFVFHAGEKVSTHTYKVTADVVCAGANVISIHVYLDEAHEIPLCTLTVGSQNGLAGLHLKHTTSPADDIDLEGKVTTLKITRDAGTCGAQKTVENGVFNFDVTMQGHNSLGEPTAVTVTDI